MRSFRTRTLLAAAALAMVVPATATASSHTETITDPTVAFQAGDPTVEIVTHDGTGALHLATPGGGDKAQVAVTELEDTTIGTLESLSYRVQRTAGTGEQIASINLALFDGPTWAGTLVYEPGYDGSAAVALDEWQTWDALGTDARWWHTSDPNRFVPWSTIATHPSSRDLTVAAVLVNQGSGNAGLVSFVDWVEVEGTTYDFAPAVEPPADPATRNDCMAGGWVDHGFANQGQCVRFVNTGQDSR